MPRTRRRLEPPGGRNRCGPLLQPRRKAEMALLTTEKRGEPWHWREPGRKTHDLSRSAERRSTQGQSPHQRARSNGRKSQSGTHRGVVRQKIRQGDVGTCKLALAEKFRTAWLSFALPYCTPSAC